MKCQDASFSKFLLDTPGRAFTVCTDYVQIIDFFPTELSFSGVGKDKLLHLGCTSPQAVFSRRAPISNGLQAKSLLACSTSYGCLFILSHNCLLMKTKRPFSPTEIFSFCCTQNTIVCDSMKVQQVGHNFETNIGGVLEAMAECRDNEWTVDVLQSS